MSLKSRPFYWLECDGCGQRSTKGGEVDAWGQAFTAVDEALENEWWIRAEEDLCPDCAAGVTCGECGEREDRNGAPLRLRDGVCAPCLEGAP